jgi:GDP/UDP-N,N'-diacetylbacillosamine 2-epimerase (hydrolysing)
MKVQHICVVTGSRADYNYLKLIIEKIDKSPKLKVSLIVTGMHLLKTHGYTIDLIKKDSLPIAKIIPMYDENEPTELKLGEAVGSSIIKFVKSLNELNPDLLLVLGDRIEPLVVVIAATTLKIPIAHVHGGDISGTLDETIRHAITKLSHLHFPATLKSAERIKLLGEEEWRIHMVGSPTVDLILEEPLLKKEAICQKLELKATDSIVLCIQHPNIFESDRAGAQMRITLQVLKDLNLQTVIIYPNNDLGSNLIIKEIEHDKGVPNFKIFKNLARIDYLSLLKGADLLIGNSSGGLIETPLFKIPVVNIGTRNKDREKGDNVINVDYNHDDIKNAVQKALSADFKKICSTVVNPYGDGTASDKIVKILEDLEITEDFLIKKLTYKV